MTIPHVGQDKVGSAPMVTQVDALGRGGGERSLMRKLMNLPCWPQLEDCLFHNTVSHQLQ